MRRESNAIVQPILNTKNAATRGLGKLKTKSSRKERSYSGPFSSLVFQPLPIRGTLALRHRYAIQSSWSCASFHALMHSYARRIVKVLCFLSQRAFAGGPSANQDNTVMSRTKATPTKKTPRHVILPHPPLITRPSAHVTCLTERFSVRAPYLILSLPSPDTNARARSQFSIPPGPWSTNASGFESTPRS